MDNKISVLTILPPVAASSRLTNGSVLLFLYYHQFQAQTLGRAQRFRPRTVYHAASCICRRVRAGSGSSVLFYRLILYPITCRNRLLHEPLFSDTVFSRIYPKVTRSTAVFNYSELPSMPHLINIVSLGSMQESPAAALACFLYRSPTPTSRSPRACSNITCEAVCRAAYFCSSFLASMRRQRSCGKHMTVGAVNLFTRMA